MSSAPSPVRPPASKSAWSVPAGPLRPAPVRTARGRRPGLVAVVVLLCSTAMVAVVAGASLPSPRQVDGAAHRLSRQFLDGYLGPDGRVVRRDQGGDTVSEGQAYAMLVAQAIGDRHRFGLAWDWAKANLQRPDGLLAWRWAEGQVQDGMPAADADLDAAWALVLAGDRFDDEGLRREGLRIAAAVLDHETVPMGDGLVLVAGPWARRPVFVNPSYVSPGAFAALADASGDRRWHAVARTSRGQLEQLLSIERPLPPDWAEATPSGGLVPRAAPGQGSQPPRYGLDAARLLARLGPCGEPWRKLARSAWPVLAGAADTGVTLAADLQGRPYASAPHPAKAVASASAAHAAGDQGARDALLVRAEALDRESPSYYGAAWLALGRLQLSSSLGDECGGS